MADHRSTERRRAYKGGQINAERLPSPDCLIRNLSDTGACLEFNTALIPLDEFDLIIQPESLNRRCRVAWRKPQRMGVRFV